MTAPGPPRLLVRRALAFGVDHTLALVLVTLLSLPFTDLGLRLPQPLLVLRTVTCTDLVTPPDWLAARLGAAQIATLRLCENRLWGWPNGREVIAVSTALVDGQRLTRLDRIPVRADLTPAPLPDLSAASVLALLALGSALIARAGRSTPGKRLFRLRLVGNAHPMRREALRLGPLILLAAWPALTPLPAPILWLFAAVLASAALGAGLLTWYYLWPFAHWTGQARWDRRAGGRVTDARSAPGRPPAPR